jgi:hypothetical protein
VKADVPMSPVGAAAAHAVKGDVEKSLKKFGELYG